MNATDHEHTQLEIAAFLAGRLSDEESRQVRNHLASCDGCASIVEAWEPAALGFRQAGKELLSPHPESLRLLQYARGELEADQDLIRHLESCAPCLLEVDSARSAAASRRTRPVRTVTRYVSMALAAGLVLGLGLATLLRTPGSRWTGGGGAIQLYTLEEAIRSSEGSMVLEVDRDSAMLPLVLLPAVPPAAKPDDVFRIEIQGPDGGIAWNERYTAAELNRYLEVSGVLTLLVPSLPEGAYTLRLVAEDGPVQEFRFEVRQR